MELFLYYLGVFAVLFIVFFLGLLYGWALHQKAVVNRIRAAMETVSKELDGEVIEINIEKDKSGMIYVYDRNTKMFMAQGKDRKEVEEVLADKFPGKRFAAPVSELKDGFTE